MVHCQTSALGHVLGGAETVVRTLLDASRPDETLMSYTGRQDEPPDDLRDPDDEAERIYLGEHPAYDQRDTLARRERGRVPKILRTWPGSRHSGPRHSEHPAA